MQDNKTQPYADLRVKTGTYEKDGKQKNRYAVVGVLFASPHFSNMYMQIDSLPLSKDWDGRVYVNPREKKPGSDVTQKKDIVPEDIPDGPIDLSQIPF